jgi:acylphosphatase
MPDLVSLHVIVRGLVQGVSFRAFVVEKGHGLGLTGEVRNLPDGQEIEVKAEGEKAQLEELVKQIKTGPPAARVEKFTTVWSKYQKKYSGFKIRY